MAVKSGWSHTAAAFMALFLSRFMLSFVEVNLPAIRRLVDAVGVVVADAAARSMGVELSVTVAGSLPLFLALTFAWGWLYHKARHG